MGEARRRKLLDPNYGIAVRTTVERSSLTGKWLCVAYILGQRTVITPHYKKEDAQAASEQVNARFNTIPRSEWKRYINGSREPISKALALLDYDDDDEMVALGRINPDGSVTVDSSLEARQEFTKYANAKMSMLTGKKFLLEPTLYPQQDVIPTYVVPSEQMNASTRNYLDSIKKEDGD